METKSANEDKLILSILCNDLYYKVKDLVNKYAQKQTDKDVINAEETMIRVLYRDSVDVDIFNDFGVLFANNFYIINQIKQTQKGDKKSFETAIHNISEFLKNQDGKQHIQQLCSKYDKGNKADRFLELAIRKIGVYLPQLMQNECDDLRRTLLKLFKEMLLFCSKK